MGVDRQKYQWKERRCGQAVTRSDTRTARASSRRHINLHSKIKKAICNFQIGRTPRRCILIGPRWHLQPVRRRYGAAQFSGSILYLDLLSFTLVMVGFPLRANPREIFQKVFRYFASQGNILQIFVSVVAELHVNFSPRRFLFVS